MVQSRIFSIALAALALASTAVSTTYERMATACSYAFERACEFVTAVAAKFEQPALRLVARPVELVQACAYALRVAKRERPRVQDQWRMCPSI